MNRPTFALELAELLDAGVMVSFAWSDNGRVVTIGGVRAWGRTLESAWRDALVRWRRC